MMLVSFMKPLVQKAHGCDLSTVLADCIDNVRAGDVLSILFIRHIGVNLSATGKSLYPSAATDRGCMGQVHRLSGSTSLHGL